ncbi:molybdopterin-dependent oxidoreductase [Fibrella forsythiae]|uniref:Molybdopterin-dependent oxidoreductase n=1 Tax=Fibrella forsythiae TaxID=2817061 RepID=A0ABS3JDR5_9BACT|nr:molybdopterin-dependent oxidoreductase [Fibrella forsythiae]MBO0947593.1 molybdopterin-dependent oxidoreductase [Fibrella forsythiae]
MKRLPGLLLGLLLLLNTSQAQTLSVSGLVTNPLTLNADALKGMPHTEVSGKEHDGKEHRYSGVALIDLLKQAGTTTGSELRGKNLAKYVVVKATDGYEAVFALPELDPEFATRSIILADAADGIALPPATGPYRIVVPDEKKQARWVRQVKSIEVRTAN